MLITNNEARIYSLGYGTMVNGKPGLGTVDLMPGANDVDPVAWEKVKDDDLVRHLVGKRVLVPEEEKDVKSLAGHKASEAIPLVENTFDRGLLLSWLEDEKRATVRQAVEAQMEKIKPEPPKKDEEREE